MPSGPGSCSMSTLVDGSTKCGRVTGFARIGRAMSGSSWLIGCRPSPRFTHCDRYQIADVDRVSDNPLRSQVVFRIEESQLDVPAVAIHSAKRTLLDVNRIQLHSAHQRIGESLHR